MGGERKKQGAHLLAHLPHLFLPEGEKSQTSLDHWRLVQYARIPSVALYTFQAMNTMNIMNYSPELSPPLSLCSYLIMNF